MPVIKQVGTKYQVELERFDGGRNTKDAPSRIGDNESPDSLNVVFDDVGSCKTRDGTSYFNTSVVEIGTNIFDGNTTYRGTMVVWAGGSMFRASGTTFVKVTTSSGRYASGVRVGYAQYQDILFNSDGTNGPYRWEGGESFYNQGISAPSAPSSVSDGAGNIAAGTYFYKVSFVNTHAVEGATGSSSAGTTLAASAAITVDGVPLGSGLNGVAQRFIYRANSAAASYKFVKTLADNVTTTFTDTIAVGAEGGAPQTDATSPKPYQIIVLHKERLFNEDNDNETLVRWTNFENPFVSALANFEPLNKGDGSNILAGGVQQDLVTIFKKNSVWVIQMEDASDDTSWIFVKTPSVVGITGLRAFEMVDNGILFAAQQNDRFVGFPIISGVDLLDTNNRLLRTKFISEKIEPDLLGISVSQMASCAMKVHDNKVHIAAFSSSTSTINDAVWWFDINRLGSEGQPGSWSKWTGVIGVNDWVVHNGILYGGSSGTDGHVLRFYNGTFTDADGSGIDSYFWTKEFGGEQAIESWFKDARFLNIWYALLGSYTMRIKWRKDGELGEGTSQVIDLTPPGDLWGTLLWGSGMWSAGGATRETQIPLGKILCRRLQAKFENERSGITPVAGRGFQVYSLKGLFNLRRQRG